MLLSLLSTLALAAAPTSKLSIPGCEFADTYQFGTATCDLKFDNRSERPIRLSNARSISSDDTIGPSSLLVPAHGVAYLKAKLAMGDASGHTVHRFEVDTDEVGQPRRYVEARGFVASVLDDPKPMADFGVVELDARLPERDVVLESQEAADFRVTGILAKPAYLDASIGGDGRTVQVRLKSDAPWGLHQTDRIKVSLNAPQQHAASILVKSDVHGDVVPADNPFALGLMRTGNDNEFLIRLTSRSGKDFRIGALGLERLKATAAVVPCAPALTGCKMVKLRIAEDQPTGEVGGVVRVDLPDLHQQLPIYVWGMLLTPQTQVKDLNEEARKAEGAKLKAVDGATSPLATPSKRIDLKEVLAEHVHEAEQPPPGGTGPLLKWSVAHQELLHGYIIYRADSQSGPFLRVNKDIVPVVATTGDAASSYQWRDTSAIKGNTYWYTISSVYSDGRKQALVGPAKAVVK